MMVSILLLAGRSNDIFAQTEMPFYGSSFSVLKDTLYKDDKGVYFHYLHDTFNMVFISDLKAGERGPRTYKLYDAQKQLRVWGEISTILNDRTDLIRHGKWMEFYPDGALRSIGYYNMDEAVDYWQFFHPNGVKRMCCNYTELAYQGQKYTIPLGPYEEFYANGQVKMIGKFKAVLEEVSEVVTDPVLQTEETVELLRPVPKRAGVWYFYDPMGQLIKKELFDPTAEE